MKKRFSATKKHFSVTQTIVWETQKTVEDLENIFWVTRKMFSAVWKIFSILQNMFSGMEIMFFVTKNTFMMSETAVTAAQKMVLVAPPMVCKIFAHSIFDGRAEFCQSEMVVFGAGPLASLLIRQIDRAQPQRPASDGA